MPAPPKFIHSDDKREVNVIEYNQTYYVAPRKIDSVNFEKQTEILETFRVFNKLSDLLKHLS